MCAPLTAESQAPMAPSGYTAFVGAGVSGVMSAELDRRLVAGGYPSFGSRPVGVNLGAYRRFRNGLMLGGEWHYLHIGDGEHLGRQVGLGGGYGTVGIGFAADLTRRLRAYPRLGLGIAGMGLWTEDEDGSGPVDFDDWLAHPNSEPVYSTLSQASMAVDAGGGLELFLGSRSGPVIGLRVGYLATPFDQGWTRDGQPVTGAPTATIAGPYARLTLGWRREQ